MRETCRAPQGVNGGQKTGRINNTRTAKNGCNMSAGEVFGHLEVEMRDYLMI